MAMDAEAREAAAGGAYVNAIQNGTIEIRDASAVLLASASIPNSNDQNLGSPDGIVANDVQIVITPSANGTADEVRILDDGAANRHQFPAASVLNSVNIVTSSNITVAVGDLSVTCSS